MVEIPDVFVRTTVDREGASSTAWLAGLPGLVDELLDRWDCEPDGALMSGGVGLIVPVQRRTAGTAVLKVSYPHPGNKHEPDAFAAWAGQGAVVLHERDDTHFAMLLERAHSTTLAELTDEDEIAQVAGRLTPTRSTPPEQPFKT